MLPEPELLIPALKIKPCAGLQLEPFWLVIEPMYPPQQPMYPPQQPMYQQPPAAFGGMPNRNVNVQPVQFSNLQTGSYAQADDTNLNLLLDIPLKVTVELGRTNKVIKDILELSQGSIIELDKLSRYVEESLPVAQDYDIDPDEMRDHLDVVKQLFA